jgi:hypothetical protein
MPQRMKRKTVGIVQPVGPDCSLLARVAHERVVIGDRPIGVDTQDLAGQRAQVLRIRSQIVVAQGYVQLTIGTKSQRARNVDVA